MAPFHHLDFNTEQIPGNLSNTRPTELHGI